MTLYQRSISLVFLLVSSVTAFSQEPPVVSAVGIYLCVDYQPFFPIGLYHFPDKREDEAVWKEVADAGFNFVLSEESGRHGIYVSRKVPWTTLRGKKVSLMETYRDPSLVQKLREFLAENEKDPSILCWHAPDEPAWFGPAGPALEPGYRLIRDHSEKPVWLNVGPSVNQVRHYGAPEELVRTCDILSEDIYPIPDGKRKAGQGYNQHAYFVGEHTGQLVQLCSENGAQAKPVWMVLQGFGWGDLGFDNPKSYVPPTKHELRFMTYDAIVHGATGILSYGPFSTESAENSQFWTDLKAMASELQRNYDFLTCPAALLPEKIDIQIAGDVEEEPIRLLIKLMSDSVRVLAVNVRPEPLENVTFSVAPKGGLLTAVKVLEEERTLPVQENKSWTDDFEGYGVHLYETDIYFSFMRRYFEEPESTGPATRQ